MIKNLLIIGLTFFHFYALSQNFSITYGFPEVTTNTGQTDPSNTPTVNGLNLNAFFSAGTAINPNASARFSFTGWPVGANDGDDNYGNYLAVLSPTIYYEVTISVMSSYTLSLTSLNFDVRRSGTGVRTFCVRSSLDNYTNNLAANTGTNSRLEVLPNDNFFWKYDSISTNNDQKGSRIDFSSAFSAITGSVTFRFYAWNSESNGGSFSIDNVNFVGVISHSANITSFLYKGSPELETEKVCVYPNPGFANNYLYISAAEISDIELVSNTAEKVKISVREVSSGKAELDLSGLNPGVYYLTLTLRNKKITKKITLNN